ENIIAAGSRLLMNNAPVRVAAGICSAVVALLTVDALGIPANVPVNTPVTLTSSSGTMGFFPNGTCTVASPTVTIAAASNFATFYFRDSTGGIPSITASAATLTSGSQPEIVLPPPSRLVFSSAPLLMGGGRCAQAVSQVQTRD